MDGFLAYHPGLNSFNKEKLLYLTNKKIIFLLASVTSVCQSMDQKIIKAWNTN